MDDKKLSQEVCKDEANGQFIQKTANPDIHKELAWAGLTGATLPPLANCTLDDLKNGKNAIPMRVKPPGKTPG